MPVHILENSSSRRGSIRDELTAEEQNLGLVDDVDNQSMISLNTHYRSTYFYRTLKYLSKFKILFIPILNWLILITYILLLYRWIYKYETMYAKSALVTAAISNTLLFGLSDTLAQSISCFVEVRENRRSIQRTASINSSISLESYLPPNLPYRDDLSNQDAFYTDYGDTRIHNRGRTNSTQGIIGYQQLSDQTEKDVFNIHRFVGFMFWGFFVSFFQTGWYWILNHFYTTEPTVVSALERVLSDQLVYSPVFLFSFFVYSNFILEGGDKFTLAEKIRKIYFGTLIANYMVWPLVQFINFLIMPRRFQVPFSSSIGVIWNCFLSMKNASN